jgi:hypothetical protein
VRFTFDPNQPPGGRVVPGSVYLRSCPLAPRRHTVVRGARLCAPQSNESESEPGFVPLDLNKNYSVAGIEYLMKGKVRRLVFQLHLFHFPADLILCALFVFSQDGYDCFIGATVLQDAESFPPLPTLVRNLFTEIRVMKLWSAMTVQGTVVSAASKFKRLARRSELDPYAIRPQIDGRVTMLETSK